MTTISTDDGHVTLINTFTVAPEKADALLELLSRATEETMRHRPGFVSANLHRSLDGTRVVNYAQWRSREDFERMLEDPEARAHMREVEGLIERFEPVLYTVAAVHDRAADHSRNESSPGGSSR